MLYANGTPSGCYRRTEGWRFPRSQSPGHASVSRRVRKTWRNWPEIPRMAANRRDEALRSSTGRLCLSQVGASPASQAIPPGAASRVASSQRLGRPRRWWGQLPASREAMTAPLRTPRGAAGSRSFPGRPVSGASCGRLGPSRRDAPPWSLGWRSVSGGPRPGGDRMGRSRLGCRGRTRAHAPRRRPAAPGHLGRPARRLVGDFCAAPPGWRLAPDVQRAVAFGRPFTRRRPAAGFWPISACFTLRRRP